MARKGADYVLANATTVTNSTGSWVSIRKTIRSEMTLLLHAVHSGTTDSFLIELEGEREDGVMDSIQFVAWSLTITASKTVPVPLSGLCYSRVRVNVTRTGSTDNLSTFKAELVENIGSRE